MPVYNDVPTMAYYPNPEKKMEDIFKGMEFCSVLDVGAGHGGVFNIDYWNKPHVVRREACDIHWIREMPDVWAIKLGVDVQKLDKHYLTNEFDFVQCCEVLEHVPDTRKALEQLVRVARKAVFITSADEMDHVGPEQAAIEKINKHQAYIKQPSVEDMLDLGFQVRVEELERRQLVAWLIKDRTCPR